MKNFVKFKFLGLFMVLCLLFSGVSMINAQKEYEDVPGPRVAVFCENNEYTNMFMKEIRTNLENRNYIVKKYKYKKIDKFNEDKFDHVIFIHRFQNQNIPEEFNKLMNKIEVKNKIKLVAISQNGTLKPENPGVECHQASYQKQNMVQVATKLMARIRERDKEQEMKKLKKKHEVQEKEQVMEKKKEIHQNKPGSGGKNR